MLTLGRVCCIIVNAYTKCSAKQFANVRSLCKDSTFVLTCQGGRNIFRRLHNLHSRGSVILNKCSGGARQRGEKMAEITHITDLSLHELQPYINTNEIQLKRYFEPQKEGIFIAESPKVIRRALEAGYEPLSLLCEEKYIHSQAADIIAGCGDITVYTAPSEVLTKLTGYKLTQGVLCAMRRKPLESAQKLLENARRVVVLEDIMNQTNIGAIIRSAAALGFDAVLLTPASSDPLYRRCVRVSMGTVFQIPWTFLEMSDYVSFLRENGFCTAAMALRHDTVSISDEALAGQEKLAVIMGTEGEGLKEETILGCDYTVKIPMFNGVDSLNVSCACAIALWELRKK